MAITGNHAPTSRAATGSDQGKNSERSQSASRHAGPAPASTAPQTPQPPLMRNGGPRNRSGATTGHGPVSRLPQHITNPPVPTRTPPAGKWPPGERHAPTPIRRAGPVPASTAPQIPRPLSVRNGGSRNRSGVAKGHGPVPRWPQHITNPPVPTRTPPAEKWPPEKQHAPTPIRHAGLVPASTAPQTSRPLSVRNGGLRNRSGATSGRGPVPRSPQHMTNQPIPDAPPPAEKWPPEKQHAPTPIRHAGLVPASTAPQTSRPLSVRNGGLRNRSGVTTGRGPVPRWPQHIPTAPRPKIPCRQPEKTQKFPANSLPAGKLPRGPGGLFPRCSDCARIG